MEQESNRLNSFTCLDPELGKLLPAFMDGKLEGKELSVFEAHLSMCERCSEDYLLRRESGKLLKEHWPEIAPPAAESSPQGEKQPGNVLLSWRVPALVPLALAAVVLLLLIPRGANESQEGSAWRPVTCTRHQYLAGHSRGAEEADHVWIVKPGELLEITLGKIPAQGEPILLVIARAGGAAENPGLPFEIVEGFPMLQVLIPDLPPESYRAEIVSGPERTPIHQVSLVVKARD